MASTKLFAVKTRNKNSAKGEDTFKFYAQTLKQTYVSGDDDQAWDAIVSDENNTMYTKIETYASNCRLFSPRHTNEPLSTAINLQAS